MHIRYVTRAHHRIDTINLKTIDFHCLSPALLCSVIISEYTRKKTSQNRFLLQSFVQDAPTCGVLSLKISVPRQCYDVITRHLHICRRQCNFTTSTDC